MVRIRRARTVLLLILLLALGTVSVYGGETPERQVTLQLRWDHQFQFAGYYVAQWKGYYREEGLDTVIRSAFKEGEILDAAEEVAEGRADFGVGAANLLIARDEGMPVKLVASVFQRSAVEYCALEATPGLTIYDLSGLNIARRENDLLDIELQALFLNEGIPPRTGSYTEITRDFTLEDLTSGAYDVVPEYLGQILYAAQESGIPLKIIKPSDYGVDFYGDTLFTSEALADQSPETVEAFRRASLKGWAYALEHPEEVADRIASQVYAEDPEGRSLEELKAFNRFQASKVLELTHYPLVEIGNINPSRWEKMNESLTRLGILTGAVDLESLIFDYEKIRIDRIQENERNIALLLAALLSALTLFFATYLKWRNDLLSKEVQVRKHAEHRLVLSNARYETIFRSSVLGITITDYDGWIRDVNDAWCRMTGRTAEALCRMNIDQLIAPECTGMDREQLAALREGRIGSYSMEKKYLRIPQGSEDRDFFYGRMVLTQIWDPEADEMLTMSMVTDVTRDVLELEAVSRSEERFRKIVGRVAQEIGSGGRPFVNNAQTLPMNLEEINLELERLFTRELEESRRKDALIRYQAKMAAMGEMIGNIAHQWRQPLNTLRLVLLNLKDNGEDPVYAEKAHEKADSLICRMSETIDDFRYFTKPRMEPRSFSLEEAMKGVLSLLEEHLRIAGITVRVRAEEMPKLYGLDNQFSHVLFNLLSNAIDAMKTQDPALPREILVEGCVDGAGALIRVRDTGPGIQEALKPKVFDMFFTTKEPEGGTGLGLYMAKGIIESAFGGTIELASSGTGCVFEIRLPRTEWREGSHATV